MKKYLLLAIIGVTVCGIGVYYSFSHFIHAGDRVVLISGLDPISGQELSRGMGYYIDDTTIVTSAHVAPDDRNIYYAISGSRKVVVSVQSRLMGRDVAILSTQDTSFTRDMDTIFASPDVKKGDIVSIPVFRSGSLVRLSGMIQESQAQVLAYDQNGEVRVFSGIILPSVPFVPGDSGAPIFTRWGKLIDVVHVE